MQFMKFKNISIAKLIAAVAILLIATQSLEAQRQPNRLPIYDDQPYHFGFILGYNQMSFNIDYIDNFQTQQYSGNQSNNIWDRDHHNQNYTYSVSGVECPSNPGFTVGIVGNLRLAKYFDLRLVPSLSFGNRTLIYNMYCYEKNESYQIKGASSMLDAVIIEFPLHVKYKSKRFHNFAAYLIGGGNLKLDATGRKNTNEDNNIIKVKTNLLDFAGEFGAGVDFYNNYFKFGIEVKMSCGLINILDKQNQILDSSFDKLRNNTFQISLTFE